MRESDIQVGPYNLNSSYLPEVNHPFLSLYYKKERDSVKIFTYSCWALKHSEVLEP